MAARVHEGAVLGTDALAGAQVADQQVRARLVLLSSRLDAFQVQVRAVRACACVRRPRTVAAGGAARGAGSARRSCMHAPRQRVKPLQSKAEFQEHRSAQQLKEASSAQCAPRSVVGAQVACYCYLAR